MVQYGQPNADRVVVFVHGFTTPGFESHRMFINMADALVGRGVSAVLFDFRGSGYSDKPFEWMNIQTEVVDLHVVVDFIRANSPAASIGLWGMSLGTAVAAEVASVRDDISAVVFWCLSADLYERFSSRYDPQLLAEDRMFLPSGFKVTQQLIEAMATVDTRASVSKIEIPKFFVHGDADDSTPFETAKEVAASAQGVADTLFVRDGAHGFKRQPALFEMARDRSAEWLTSQL